MVPTHGIQGKVMDNRGSSLGICSPCTSVIEKDIEERQLSIFSHHPLNSQELNVE